MKKYYFGNSFDLAVSDWCKVIKRRKQSSPQTSKRSGADNLSQCAHLVLPVCCHSGLYKDILWSYFESEQAGSKGYTVRTRLGTVSKAVFPSGVDYQTHSCWARLGWLCRGFCGQTALHISLTRSCPSQNAAYEGSKSAYQAQTSNAKSQSLATRLCSNLILFLRMKLKWKWKLISKKTPHEGFHKWKIYFPSTSQKRSGPR